MCKVSPVIDIAPGIAVVRALQTACVTAEEQTHKQLRF